MPSRKRVTPWSRSGCSTCKRRHKKCDNEQPVCSNCCRLGLECIPSDNFSNIRTTVTSSYKDRIRIHSRSFKERTAKTPSPPYSVQSFQENESQSAATVECEPVAALQLMHLASPANTLGDSQFDITSGQQQLFQYYVERLSGILVNASGQGNPLRTLIIPLARTSPLLFQGVCAVSCIHRSGFMGGVQSRTYRNEAMGYYVRGLSSLKDLLPAALDPTSMGQDRVDVPSGEQLILFQSLLLSAIFLCKFEIIKDGITNWRKHLDGVVSFYKWLESRRWAYVMPETMDFARSFIIYHKGIACLTEIGRHTTRDAEEFPKLIEHDFYNLDDQKRQSSDLQTIDPYMGFSQTLVILFRRVTNLLFIDVQGDNSLLAVKIELLSILDRLSDKDWTAEHFLIPRSMTSDVVKCLESISQAYEGAIYTCIYSAIEELIKRCKRSAQTRTLVQEVEQLKLMIPVTKEDALEKSLAGIEAVPCQSPEEAGLLPVLFVVACETDDPDQVAVVMQRLDVLEAHIGLGNIHSAVILLREILDRRARGRKRNDWRNLLAASSWDLIIT